MPHDSFYHGIFSFLGCPLSSSEISLWNPSLIDIDDMLSLAVDLEHLLGVKRAQHYVRLGVARERHALDPPVA